MRRLYILIVLMAAAMGIHAQAIQNQEFAKANFYYNENRYDTALVIYEKIIEEGYVSAPLLYNIGNTYFKMRNYPMAILNYEKALKLEPNNEEIMQNLAIANALINDKINPMPEFFLTRWWKNIGNMLSVNGWAKMTLGLFGILLILVFLYLTSHTRGIRKTTFFTSILVLLLFICSVVFATQKYRYIKEHNEAIVMTPTISVKSSPSASGVDLFILHEGSKVEIIDNVGDWDKIKIADGNSGWMPSNSSIKY